MTIFTLFDDGFGKGYHEVHLKFCADRTKTGYTNFLEIQSSITMALESF